MCDYYGIRAKCGRQRLSKNEIEMKNINEDGAGVGTCVRWGCQSAGRGVCSPSSLLVNLDMFKNVQNIFERFQPRHLFASTANRVTPEKQCRHNTQQTVDSGTAYLLPISGCLAVVVIVCPPGGLHRTPPGGKTFSKF